jgi:hypothetical protein
MSEQAKSISSLQAEVLDAIEHMPTFARSSKRVRVAAARELTRSITHADPARPLSFEEARRELRQLARPTSTGKRSAIQLLLSRSAGMPRKRPRPSQAAGTRLGVSGPKVRFAKGAGSRVEAKVVDLEKLAKLYPRGGKVPMVELIENGVVRTTTVHPGKARNAGDVVRK